MPAAVLLYVARERRPTPGTTALLVIAVVSALAFTVPRGDRGLIVYAVLPLLAVPFLRRGRRPSALTVGIALLLAILAINVLRAERNKSTRESFVTTAVETITSPLDQFKSFILGPDPSLFSVLALEYAIVPERVDFQPGVTLAALVAGPVPSLVWEGKPEVATRDVTDYLFSQQAQVARATNVPSLLGDAYADYGFLAVAIQLGLLGVVFRGVHAFYRRHPANPAAQLLLAVSLPVIFDLLRNTIPDAVGRSVFVVAPVLVCVYVCSRPPGRLLPDLRNRAPLSPAQS
jgi:hypothetical protein